MHCRPRRGECDRQGSPVALRETYLSRSWTGQRSITNPPDNAQVDEPAYPAAHAAAAVVDAFLRRRTAVADGAAIPLPEADWVAAVIDAAFWASLLRMEGRSPRISLALAPPDMDGQPMMFERPRRLTPDHLNRLAPAVERPGVHLGVWLTDGELRVWGAPRTLPAHCVVLEVVEPGLMVLKYNRGPEFGKFGNIAVLSGHRVRVVDERTDRLADRPELHEVLLGLEADTPSVHGGGTLVQLAISMRAHGRGGSLLVVPDGTEAWRESIVQPVSYAISPPFSRFGDLLTMPVDERERSGDHDGIGRLVETIAGLTAVDGATIMSDRFVLLAFGAKIGRREGHGAVERVVVTEPVDDDVPSLLMPTQLGGTRHLSAAQFVHDQHDAIALVASQDGRFTVFAWSAARSMVRAHRIEALLL
jgi:hypothetical protein